MADINDNTINITISAPSVDSNTISVVNPALKNNVVVNDARITPSERAKLAGIQAGATADQSIQTGDGLSGGASSGDVTLSVDNTVVRTTGDQSIGGVKTFTDGITINNDADVNFNTSTTTFGIGATVKFEGIDPQFKTDSVRFNGSGTQLLKKEGSGDFNIENQGGGNLTITNAASGTTKLKSSSGDLILESGQGSSDRVRINARDGIEVKLSHDNVNVSSPFKIIDANTQAGTETDVFTVDRSGDVTIKDANDNEIFFVKTSPEPGETLDFIRVGGTGGYKFPKLDPNVSLQNKALVVKDVPSTDPDFGKMEFRDFVATSIFDMSEVDETSTSITDGETLVWDDQAQKFVGQVVLSNASLDDLSDVTLPGTIPSNYALVWNGSTWEPQQQTDTTELSTDASPTLSADLDVSDNSIVTTSGNKDISITPHGTGNVSLGSFEFDADQSIGAGQDDYVLTYNHNSGNGYISLEEPASTVTDLDDLSDVDLSGGVSQGDVIQAEANGTFSPQNALQAFMSAAYLLADNANAPLPSGALGDFNGDGVVDADDLTLFLGMFGGSSVFDGNTNITFSDISPQASNTSAQSFTIDSSNYNTQASTTFLDQLFLTAASDSNSVDIYNWTVNTTSQTDHNIQFDTTGSVEMSDWFSTAKLYFQDPSEMVFDIAGFQDTTEFNFCLYLGVTRRYPSGTFETTDLYPLSTYLFVPTVGTVNLNQNGQIVVDDVFSQNAESVMPRDVFLRFYVCPDPSSFEGTVTYSFNNLKLKVAS